MLTIGTIGRFFVGDSLAIATIANCRHSLWLGAMLVLSAGFAREYDGEDLLYEPWHLLLPLAASFVTSLLLYVLFFLASWGKSTDRPRFVDDYGRFLSLYWMTAPLAWVYAIPVEQFLSAPDAVRANFWFLGIVSLWRVLLISRASSILFGSSFRAALLLTLFFADTLVLFILWATPVPVFSVMGGIRLTESEGIIQATHFIVQSLGFVTWIVWFIAASVIIARRNDDWELLPHDSERPIISRLVWLTAVASLLVWTFILPFTQRPQQLRRAMEYEFYNGRVDNAVRLMSTHARDDYPSHWDSPPRIGYGDDFSLLLSALRTSADLPVEHWTRKLYVDKLTTQLQTNDVFWETLSDEEMSQLAEMLPLLPDVQLVVRQNSSMLYVPNSDDENVSERDTAIRAVLKTVAAPSTEPSE